MGSQFFMIQEVAKIDDIASYIGKAKMKEPPVVYDYKSVRTGLEIRNLIISQIMLTSV